MLAQIQSLSPILITVVIAALAFDFVNGWNDSANAIATVVSTRVLSPLKSVLMAAVLNLAGALAGTAVAKTIFSGLISTDVSIISPDAVIVVALAAMLGAIVWAAAMTVLGLPISGSHSLVGGLAGAAVAASGVKVLIGSGIGKVLLAMLLSPLLGGLLGYLLMLILTWTVYKFHPVIINKVFSKLQILSSAFMAFNHGLNDAQKVMGIITMALVAGKIQFADAAGEIHPELWVKLSCGLMIALGTAIGGWKVIKTLGMGLSKLTPFDGFSAETSASLVLLLAASLGLPVSTTHTITGSITGVGVAKGLNSVKWGVGQKILLAWIFTLPTCAALAGAIYWILGTLFGTI